MENTSLGRARSWWICLPSLFLGVACGQQAPAAPSSATTSVTISAVCSVTIQPSQTSFNLSGGQTTLQVTTAVPTCEWVVVAPGWIHAQPTLGTGDATLVLQVDPSASTRQATIYIGTGSAQVEQASSTTNCSATLQLSLATFDDVGGQTMAQITSSVAGCDWTIQADKWIHLPQSSGTGNATLLVRVDPTDRSRSGSVLLVVHTPGSSKYSSVRITQTSRVVLPLSFTSATCGSIQAGGPTKPSLCYFVLAPGTNPDSDNVRVFADLRPVGGRDGVQLLKEIGTGGLEFSLDLSVPAGVSPGVKVIPVTAYDGQGRTATASATLTVLPPG